MDLYGAPFDKLRAWLKHFQRRCRPSSLRVKPDVVNARTARLKPCPFKATDGLH